MYFFLLTCWPQADFKDLNLMTLPLLKPHSVSISHCLSVFLKDSNTGCISWQKQQQQQQQKQQLTLYTNHCENQSDWTFSVEQRHRENAQGTYEFSKIIHSLAEQSREPQCKRSLLFLRLWKYAQWASWGERVHVEFKGHILINVKHQGAFLCLRIAKIITLLTR